MMTPINAQGLSFKEINELIRQAGKSCVIDGCCGERFLAAGMSEKNITIRGVLPGS